MNRNALLGAATALAVLTAGGDRATAGTLEVEFDAGNFVPGAAIDNPYLPLVAGTVFVYSAVSPDGCEVNEVAVTAATKSDFAAPYDSIVALEVRDREWLDPECGGDYALMEDTRDWFAQDLDGNVWYLGEDTTAWDDEDECPSSAGGWQAGTDGAEPGIVMLAEPVSGLAYQQELFEGEAEDWAKVLNMDATVSIALGTFAGCLVTKEYTPLEPGSIEHKFYCPEGGGLVLIHEFGGPLKRVELIGDTLPAGDFAEQGVCP